MPLSTPIAVVASMDDLSRDLLLSSLSMGAHRCVCLRHSIDPESGTLTRVISDVTGIVERSTVELEHACASCAMREDAVPVLQRLVDSGRWSAILYALPLAADPLPIVSGLGGEARSSCAVRGAHLGQVITVQQAATLADDLLGAHLLEGEEFAYAGDDRTVGEALTAQVEYADIVVLDEPHDAAQELLRHLAWEETTRVVTNPFELSDCEVFDTAHDGAIAVGRRDPENVRPGVGTDELGSEPADGTIWTLDLVSRRPFHPERLIEVAEDFGRGRVRARGHFWVPTRPSAVCQWEGAGGSVSIGSVGEPTVSSGPDGLPTTHLVVTGDRASDRERIARTFRSLLLTDEEWADGLVPWLGVDDGLNEWLGERGAHTNAA